MTKNRHLGSTLEEITKRAIDAHPRHAGAMLREAAQCLLDNELDVARALIRQVIKTTMGYVAVSKLTGTPETSIVRMFGPKGRPTAANLFNVLAALQDRSRIRFEVRTVVQSKRMGRRRKTPALRRAA